MVATESTTIVKKISILVNIFKLIKGAKFDYDLVGTLFIRNCLLSNRL